MSSTFTDQKIICVDCGKEFIFKAKDQEFFKSKNFVPPRHCWPCRQLRKAERQEVEDERLSNSNQGPYSKLPEYY